MTTSAVIPYRERLPDGGLKLNFHPGQNKAWYSPKRFIAMLAGKQSGKTCFGADWMAREIAEKGAGDYLAVSSTFPLLNLKMIPEYQEVFEHNHQLGELVQRRGTLFIDFYSSPTRIIFGSATNPESIESATAKAAHLDEVGQKQFRRESWEAVQGRLALNRGRCLFTTSLYVFGWFKLEIYDTWKAGAEDIEVIQFPSTLNPTFSTAEYNRLKVNLPQWKFRMQYQGLFDRPAGLIYDCFDSDVAVIDRVDIPKEWPRYVGHDFGSAHMAAMWYAEDPQTGLFWAYREYLSGGKSVGEHAQEFKRLSQGENIVKRVGGSHQEQGWREAFTQAGWPISEPKLFTTHPHDAVETGILRVYELHKLNRVLVFRDLYGYLGEKTTYSRELDDNYEPTEKIEDKESYHLMDSERYILGEFTPELAMQQSGEVWTW